MPLVRKPGGSGERRAAAPDLAAVEQGLRAGDDQRWAAARAAAALPASVPALGRALRQERNPRVREAILTALARIGTPQSAETVLPLLRSDDARVRSGALDALKAMPRAAAPYLPALMRDDNAAVRVLACEIVRGMPKDAALPLLCERLDADPEPNVCAAAIDALAEIGGAEALPALERCAERFAAAPFLVFAVEVAVARLRSQDPHT